MAPADLLDRVRDLECKLEQVVAERRAEANRLTILVFSCEVDRLRAAFTVATGAAAMGIEVTMFFASSATTALRRTRELKPDALLDELLTLARELSIRLVCCISSIAMLGIEQSELMENVEPGGVATYLAAATRSRVSLFI